MVTKYELDALKEENETVHYFSHYDFLMQHRGWRPGKIHTLLGPASGGKSTLIRSLMRDAVSGPNASKVVSLWLSEETLTDAKTSLAYGAMSLEQINRIKLFSEVGFKKFKTLRDVISMIRFYLGEVKPDLFIYDNITTCRFYSSARAQDQDNFLNELKDISTETDIPFLLVAHTKKENGGFQRLIEAGDVRGSATLENISEYFYILQPLYVENETHTFLRIVKYRHHSVKENSYKLFYYPSKKIYGQAEVVNFGAIKEIFKQRNKL